jgi:hypothetical protein
VSPRYSLRRHEGERNLRTRLSIYCEGDETEPEYFRQMKARLIDRMTTKRDAPLVSIYPMGRSDPLDIVQRTIDDRERDGLEGDMYWCVFDVEAPQSHGRLDQAVSLANQNDIPCAISNPCFELWLILHYRDRRSYITTKQACELLERLLPGYSKGRKRVRLAALPDEHSAACTRARYLDKLHIEKSLREQNPGTSVWRLVDLLMNLYDFRCSAGQ